eukprot:SAG11_NODE_1984_length_3964_cov_26.503234_2_plen_35_part_00
MRNFNLSKVVLNLVGIPLCKSSPPVVRKRPILAV